MKIIIMYLTSKIYIIHSLSLALSLTYSNENYKNFYETIEVEFQNRSKMPRLISSAFAVNN